MKAISITYIILLITFTISVIIIGLSEYLPMIFDRKSWNVWKQCYNNDNFIKMQDRPMCMRYDWMDSNYSAIVFKEDDGKYYASIFEHDVHTYKIYGMPIFCTFYAYHSRKLAKKLIGE